MEHSSKSDKLLIITAGTVATLPLYSAAIPIHVFSSDCGLGNAVSNRRGLYRIISRIEMAPHIRCSNHCVHVLTRSLYKVCSVFLCSPSNFADEYNSFCLRIFHESFQAIHKVGSIERVTSNTNAGRLSQSDLHLRSKGHIQTLSVLAATAFFPLASYVVCIC